MAIFRRTKVLGKTPSWEKLPNNPLTLFAGVPMRAGFPVVKMAIAGQDGQDLH